MEIHDIIEGSTSYPIGLHILSNIPVINNMADAIGSVCKEYYPEKNSIDLYCKGSSGAIISAIVSNVLINNYGKTVFIHHIKKDGEQSHDYNTINDGRLKMHQSVNIIIDDFIATGNTIRSIVEKLKPHCNMIDILCVTGDNIHSFIDDFNHIICSK